ncbi:MAG: hypothetical protein ABSE86_19965 [Bryobacteraceae bacterium]|jgi:hypothetical protein
MEMRAAGRFVTILALVLIPFTGHAAPTEPPAVIQKYLKQPGFTWKCARETNFQFCWEASLDGDSNMAAARDSAEAARNEVLRSAGVAKYETLIYVLFLASADRMEKLIGYHGEGRSRPAQHAVFFVPTPIRPNLTHELCHEILTNVWGVAEAWIEEGFATLAAERGLVHVTCLAMTIRHAMIPLKELVRPEWNPSVYSPDITYVELAGFLEFLEAAYGLERIKQVWRRGSMSIPGVLGKSVAILEREWHIQLQREIAKG